MNPDTVLSVGGKSVDLNRYELVCKSAASSSISQQQDDKAFPVKVCVKNRTIAAYMDSTSPLSLKQVQVMDISGRTLSQLTYRGALSVQVPSSVGLRVVRFILSDGSTYAFRLWVD